MHERNVLMKNMTFARICSKCTNYFALKNVLGQLTGSNCLRGNYLKGN